MKQGKANKSFAKRMHWSQNTASSNNTRDSSTHGHHQMVNTEIRMIIFFIAENGKAVYSQQKTIPGTDCGSDISSYCKIQAQLEESRENHQAIQVLIKSNPLIIHWG